MSRASQGICHKEMTCFLPPNVTSCLLPILFPRKCVPGGKTARSGTAEPQTAPTFASPFCCRYKPRTPPTHTAPGVLARVVAVVAGGTRSNHPPCSASTRCTKPIDHFNHRVPPSFPPFPTAQARGYNSRKAPVQEGPVGQGAPWERLQPLCRAHDPSAGECRWQGGQRRRDRGLVPKHVGHRVGKGDSQEILVRLSLLLPFYPPRPHFLSLISSIPL